MRKILVPQQQKWPQNAGIYCKMRKTWQVWNTYEITLPVLLLRTSSSVSEKIYV